MNADLQLQSEVKMNGYQNFSLDIDNLAIAFTAVGGSQVFCACLLNI